MPLGTLGKYERLDVLGHGVSGIVYLAKDTLLNKQVALKEVDVQAGDMSRFLEEARVMDRLRHPNIVRVNGVDRIEGKIVIDMEYVRGQNLQDLLRVEGRLPVDRAIHIAEQTLDALEFAHRMQTVHRDIKPANILIDRDGEVKLVDFGLAEILATNAYAGGAGTYAYMAPEDFAEEDRSDHQSDIWAVGVTLFEMLTGHRPFQAVKVKDPFSWKRVLDTEPPIPLSTYLPEANRQLQTILNRALEREKNRRYQTAGAFRADLLRLLPEQSNGKRWEEPSQPLAERLSIAPVPPRARLFPDPPEEERTQVSKKPAWLQPGAQSTEDRKQEIAVNEPAPVGRRSRTPFFRRKSEVARLTVEPQSVDFGALRKGEVSSVKIQVRMVGTEGMVSGRVAHTPAWATAHPVIFDRNRQSITLTAHSGRTWETGEFTDAIQLETDAGSADIPVRLVVMKARPTFRQVALWFVPAFTTVLLPSLAVAVGGGMPHNTNSMTQIVPSAAMTSSLLALMLLLVGIAADIGIAERFACGMLMTVMFLVTGAAVANAGAGVHGAAETAILLGCVLVLQVLNFSRWKLWALVVACLGLAISGVFLRFIAG